MQESVVTGAVIDPGIRIYRVQAQESVIDARISTSVIAARIKNQ
jgi:hypothetical protein